MGLWLLTNVARFNIFYPDLIDKSKAPTYKIEKDPDSAETVLIRFSAGPPYEVCIHSGIE